ncbi:MAG: NADH-quinone oxidoreductase subunit F, partial [Deltaproteobacteria bacterium]
MKFESVEKFAEQAESILAERNKFKRRLFVCAGSACVAGGALELFEQLAAEVKQKNLPVTVELRNEHYWQAQDGKQMLSLGGCQGLCQMGPVVYVYPDDIFYCKVRPKDAAELLEHTVLQEKPLERLLYKDPKSSKQLRGKKDIPFFKSQKFVALDKCGIVDPYSLEDYIAVGGYRALVKALSQMSPDEIVDTVDKSGLRGRGGGGFPTGRKWKSCLKAGGDTRYVICNGDEGDPGAFMDCSIMEGLPFKVIEGMTIGGYALRSSQGFIYVRHEYPRAVERLQNAIERAREAGLLGENILGSGFSFDIKISRGGGAFVCGESSALMQSLEGRVGEPRPKYIHSTERGLYDKPTVLNNVETWACVPEIVNNGADWFASMGTEKSKGTKAFSLVGKVNNTGLIEVPMGMTLRQIIFD